MRFILICYALIAAVGLYGCGNKANSGVSDIVNQESTYYGIPCVSFDTQNNLKTETVMELYKKMQQEGKEKGYVPFIIHDDGRNNENIESSIEYYESMTEYYLDSYKNINIEQFFLKLKEEYEDCTIYDSNWLENFIETSPDLDTSYFPDVMNQEELELGYMIPEVFILKVPVTKPYEVLAYFPVGGFHSCPLTEELMAVSKYWYESYGAVLCAAGSDTLLFYLEKPLKSEIKAKSAAIESFLVCSDVCSQSNNPLDSLKESINKSNYWSFWWD